MTNLDISTKISLRADKNNGRLEPRRAYLWHPLLRDVVKRCGRHDAEAEDEHISVWIAEWPQQIKVILTSTAASTNVKLYPNLSRHRVSLCETNVSKISTYVNSDLSSSY